MKPVISSIDVLLLPGQTCTSWI